MPRSTKESKCPFCYCALSTRNGALQRHLSSSQRCRDLSNDQCRRAAAIQLEIPADVAKELNLDNVDPALSPSSIRGTESSLEGDNHSNEDILDAAASDHQDPTTVNDDFPDCFSQDDLATADEGEYDDLRSASPADGESNDHFDDSPEVITFNLDPAEEDEDDELSLPPRFNNNQVPEFQHALSGLSSEVVRQLCKIHSPDRIPACSMEGRTPTILSLFVELLELLDDAKCPHFLFEKILNWCTRASPVTNGFDIRTMPPITRVGFLNQLRKFVGMKRNERNFECVTVAKETENHAAHVLSVPLKKSRTEKGESTSVGPQTSTEAQRDGAKEYKRSVADKRDVCTVIRFPFVMQLQALLENRTFFGNLDNLVVNPQCPWLPYRARPGENCDEILSGSWYHDTCTSLGLYEINTMEEWVQAGKPFCIPLILYIDKTGTDMMCRYTLEPLIFTVGILKRPL